MTNAALEQRIAELEAQKERPFDKCYQRGCKKAPVQVVRTSFPDGENKPIALSYCKKHGDFMAAYIPIVAVVKIQSKGTLRKAPRRSVIISPASKRN